MHYPSYHCAGSSSFLINMCPLPILFLLLFWFLFVSLLCLGYFWLEEIKLTWLCVFHVTTRSSGLQAPHKQLTRTEHPVAHKSLSAITVVQKMVCHFWPSRLKLHAWVRRNNRNSIFSLTYITGLFLQGRVCNQKQVHHISANFFKYVARIFNTTW